jgi:hypothetical protein
MGGGLTRPVHSSTTDRRRAVAPECHERRGAASLKSLPQAEAGSARNPPGRAGLQSPPSPDDLERLCERGDGGGVGGFGDHL